MKPTLAFLFALGLWFGLGVASPAEAQFCTREYRPVCGVTRGGAEKTYSNACVARAARARIVHRGRCRAVSACTMIYRPVCAKVRGGWRKTYPNACVARASSARPLYFGRCRR